MDKTYFKKRIQYGAQCYSIVFWNALANKAGALENAAKKAKMLCQDRALERSGKMISSMIDDLNEATEDLCASMNA